MHSPAFFTLLTLGLGANAVAGRVTILPRQEGAAPAAAPAPGAAMGQPAAAAAPAAGANTNAAATANPGCAQSMILAQAIAVNIADQQQELATANQLSNILQTQPVDAQAFATQRQALVQFVNNGIAIRQANQLITPAGNQATPGVATVANAQLMELSITGSLTATGTDDVQGNLKKVQMLQMAFAGGIQQNMKNMADAMAGCGATGAAGAAGATAGAGATTAAAAPAPAAAGATNSTGAKGEGATAAASPAGGASASASNGTSKGEAGAKPAAAERRSALLFRA